MKETKKYFRNGLYHHRNRGRVLVFAVLVFAAAGVFAEHQLSSASYPSSTSKIVSEGAKRSEQGNAGQKPEPEPETIDKALYDEKMLTLANRLEPKMSSTTASSSSSSSVSVPQPEADHLWPPEAPYPEPGAILPFSRVVAFYGNFYSKNMGVLGKYQPGIVLEKLKNRVSKWEKADPDTPVVPAVDYIAVTAQGQPGADGGYRQRMPKDQIEKATKLADRAEGITILEVQPGYASLLEEVKYLESFLKQPKVHLAIDPEFIMREGNVPGEVIGSVTAAQVNAVGQYLSDLVNEYDLPPKILVVHRFTKGMVQNLQQIEPLPEVQIVMDMDGWGTKPDKKKSYRRVIFPDPVQFAGFKVFFENDRRAPSTGLMSPEEILELRPKPIFIQYQ